MKQKRGQFFLLAAIILVSILAGIFLYSNQVFLQDSKDGIKLLKEEVGDETNVVINYYLYKNEDNLEDFIGKMSESLLSRNPNLEMIFFYTNETNLHVFNLAEDEINLTVNNNNQIIAPQKQALIVPISLGGVSLTLDLQELVANGNITSISLGDFGINPQNLTFVMNQTTYTLDWLKEKRFSFIIKQNIGGETYADTS